MAFRPSCAHLVDRLRDLVGDPFSPTSFWTNEQLQDRLDERRVYVRYALLEPWGTPAPYTGIISYLDYFSENGNWEADAQLFGPAWQLLTTATQDYLTGHWTFASSQIPAVRIVGKQYDIYGSAADVLEAWAATSAQDFDFQAQGVKYARNQVTLNRLALAAKYRALQKPTGMLMMRGDEQSDFHDNPGFLPLW